MKKWSDDILEKTISLAKEGKSYKDISLIVDKTTKSIRCKLNKLGIKNTDYKIFKRNNINYCLNCGSEITYEKKFCNHSCSAIYNNIKGGERTDEVKNKIKLSTIKNLGFDSIEEWEKIKQIDKNVYYCKCCGAELNKRKEFCNHNCQIKFYYDDFITNWKNGEIEYIKSYKISTTIRKYLFKKYDNKCARCGWGEVNEYTGKVPLEVEHIDGNSENNKEENLTLLCPNCHSLTKTYKGANRGNGRHNRMVRYRNGQSF